MALRRSLVAALAILALAPAAFAATFTVNTVVDAPDIAPGDGVCLTAGGVCTLRAAIEEANTTTAVDTIGFAIPGPGVHTITTTALPTVTRPVIVDGFTQPGSQPNTNPTGALNTVLNIELAGGLRLVGGSSTVRGLVVNGGSVAFGTSAAAGENVVEGCFVGTDPTGMQSRSFLDGVTIVDTGRPARVGGSLPAQRNLISGNATGVYVACLGYGLSSCNAGTVIRGNLIGTTATGASTLPNTMGVTTLTSGGITVGGGSAGERNVVSGNDVAGIRIVGTSLNQLLRIHGNRIGVDDTGTSMLPNGIGVDLEYACNQNGCVIGSGPFVEIGGSPATANVIARNRFEGVLVHPGIVTVAHNTIAGNGSDGVFLQTTRGVQADIFENQINGNVGHGIAVDATSQSATLTIARNVIHANTLNGVTLVGTVSAGMTTNSFAFNGGLAVDLGANGVTANDFLDQDVGPNGLMNSPVLAYACEGISGSVVTGTIHTRPSTPVTVELFRNAACDPSGSGEGDEPVGTVALTTDAGGNAAFSSFSSALVTGDFVTATATTAEGTSELARCIQVGSPPPAQIIAGPTAVCSGTPFTLEGAPGAESYQWFRDGTAIPGATGLRYSRPSAAAGDAGTYTVQGSSCGGTATSPNHPLAVVSCSATPVRLDVDIHAAAGTSSDFNRVLEPGESVLVEPRYRNTTAAAIAFSGTASLTGTPPASYSLPDASASYGTVAAGQLTDCFGATGDCYRANVTGPRPQAHWDATLVETITGAGDPPRYWPVHIGETFSDVPRADTFYRFVEALVHNGVTAGCSGSTYCPSAPTSRQQLAVFVLVAREGVGYAPPACDPAAPRFADVPASNPFCRWIEELARRGVVSGCGANAYCPLTNVPRNQMAVFVLATREAPGYTPPACVAGAEVFTDVPASSPFCRWIEELARRGVVGGCSAGTYCPGAPVSRGEMSVFIVATFGLLLYGP
jgi:CSLREA domain-containing protein